MITIASYSFYFAFVCALQSVSLVPRVILAPLPITISAGDNMAHFYLGEVANMSSNPQSCCHGHHYHSHQCYKKQQRLCQRHQQNTNKQYLCICTLPATAIAITDLESFSFFFSFFYSDSGRRLSFESSWSLPHTERS